MLGKARVVRQALEAIAETKPHLVKISNADVRPIQCNTMADCGTLAR